MADKHGRTMVSCVQCGTARLVRLRKDRPSSGLCKKCTCRKAWIVKGELDALKRICRWKPKSLRKTRPRADLVVLTCEHCGTVFERAPALAKTARFCSRSCVGSTLKRLVNKPSSRACVICDVLFSPMPYLHSHRQVTCSIECDAIRLREANNAGKARRRVSLRSGNQSTREWYITAHTVFKRDGWQCQACGCSTPKSLRGTYHDNAPEQDHIIAVAEGGSHTLDNLQCLCRLCNQLKSSISMKDFMFKWHSKAA